MSAACFDSQSRIPLTELLSKIENREESFLNSLHTIHGDFNLIFHNLLTIMRSSSSSKKGQLLIALVVTLRVISQERQSLRCWFSCLHGKLAPRPFQFPHDGGENEVMHP